MSVKHGLLALLERGPMYGYQLRAAFDAATGGTWPLNIGQVYTTLSRLERDDLVVALPENEGQRPYEITAPGRDELKKWFSSPVRRSDRPRDEVAIKLALAITTPGVPWLLVLDAMIFQAEAELRWLDHCEASLVRYEPQIPRTTDVEVPR
jgi:DNA-binding PadR family transcriptional regulator